MRIRYQRIKLQKTRSNASKNLILLLFKTIEWFEQRKFIFIFTAHQSACKFKILSIRRLPRLQFPTIKFLVQKCIQDTIFFRHNCASAPLWNRMVWLQRLIFKTKIQKRNNAAENIIDTIFTWRYCSGFLRSRMRRLNRLNRRMRQKRSNARQLVCRCRIAWNDTRQPLPYSLRWWLNLLRRELPNRLTEQRRNIDKNWIR